MNEAQTKAAELLVLQEEQYFAFSDQSALERQAKLAAMFRRFPPPPPGTASEEPSFVAIGAPKAVDMARRDDVPVLIAARYTGRRQWEVAFDQNTWIVVSDLHSGAVLVGQPFIKGKREKTPELSMSGEPPDEINAGSVINSVRRIDLRKAVPLEWRPSRLAVTVIIYDWVSNTVVVELEGGQQPLAEIRSPHSAVLSVPAEVSAGGPIPVRGTIALPDNSAVPATVLLLKRDERPPARIDLTVPASFEFDLRTALPEQTLSGTYQTYLIVRDRVSGPFPITIGH